MAGIEDLFSYEALTGREKPESVLRREKELEEMKLRRRQASEIQGGGIGNALAMLGNYALAEPLAFVGSALPGETFTYKNLSEKLKTPLKYDEAAVERIFGKPKTSSSSPKRL